MSLIKNYTTWCKDIINGQPVIARMPQLVSLHLHEEPWENHDASGILKIRLAVSPDAECELIWFCIDKKGDKFSVHSWIKDKPHRSNTKILNESIAELYEVCLERNVTELLL